MAVSFENTEIAFSHQSNKALKKAYWMFKMVGRPWMVRLGSVVTKIALGLRLPVEGMIKSTIFQQFCGGESIDDCREDVEELWKYKVGSILDYSVEGKEKEAVFEATAKQIIRTLEHAKNNPAIPFGVFKVTGIARYEHLQKISKTAEIPNGEEEEYRKFYKRVESICQKAAELRVPVLIDAEESWYQDAIDRLVEEMMERFNKEQPIVFQTIQLYRKDRLDYLRELHGRARDKGYVPGLKLVRGAYMEKERKRAKKKGYPSPIHDSKGDTDQAFNAALAYCIDHIEEMMICAGTHNEDSTLFLIQLMKNKLILRKDERIWFSQLYGMSDNISFNLADAGYNVAKYLPYGPVRDVMPYLIRRARENTSVAGQSPRELMMIETEIRRRESI